MKNKQEIIVTNSADQSSENTKNNQKQEFQEKGRIDVKPFIDYSDGGYLTPKNSDQTHFILIIIVSIVVLWMIANSFLPLFRQDTQIEEDTSKTDAPAPSEAQQSMTVTSETVTYTDNYNDTVIQEEQPIITQNFQDLLPNQAEQERLKVKQIFDNNKLDNQEVNTYE